ncbi:MAG: GspE/PulE family protein [Candidatus Latescibacter sp.]|nr:GspE/PulE family protein [Candidatus Latescibacter sp.]
MTFSNELKLCKNLVDSGLITQGQLDVALNDQSRTKESLVNILHNLGFISKDQASSSMAELAGVERVELNQLQIASEVLRLVPLSFAQKYRLIPLSRENQSLTVAMCDPLNVLVIDQLRRQTGFHIKPVFALESEITQALEHYYGRKAESETAKDALENGPGETGVEMAAKQITQTTPVMQLVDQLIAKAIGDEATDIHIEPGAKLVRTRFRIDGILYQGTTIPKNLQHTVTTRLKIMADLNISESRLPQDGKIIFSLGNKDIDIRISTFPVIYGENIVLRILDKERLILGLDHLGFSPSNLAVFQKAIRRPNGIILVTGPTGSGKTTTLYSTLSAINSFEQNIITLEDPVEYELQSIRQSQVNLKAGFTFPVGLRSILRQDPDVILVGEMRDKETIEVAIRAALTGHLVFSTLHTNDAPGAVPRLLDMGIESYLLASSLVLVIAQRLVRNICTHCKTIGEPKEEHIRAIGWETAQVKQMSFYYGRGCSHCHNTGYRGRMAIFEILPVSLKIRDLIVEKADSGAILNAARKEGMTTMLEDGVQKVKAGITTLEEVIRVAYSE